MNIEVAKSEIFGSLASSFGVSVTEAGITIPNKRWADLSPRVQRWTVAAILSNRGDYYGKEIGRMVQSGNSHYNNFVLMDDLPDNMGI